MTTDRFFKYLGRINAVGIFAVLVYFLVSFFLSLSEIQPWDADFPDHERYGSLASDNGIEGEEVETTGGGVVVYRMRSDVQERIESDADNISLTDRETGKSRTVLPNGSEQLVLSWDVLRVPSNGGEHAAWVALVGTEGDYSEGVLDLVVGRFSDLEQSTLARRLRFVDSPRLIDNSTMTLIAWPENDRAEFWIIDLQTMSIVSKRPVALPARTGDERGEGSEDSAEDIVVSMD